MKRIIILLFILILLTSCSTQQRVVYRDCNCNATNFGFGWNYNPYWGWNDPFWGWGWRNQIVIVPYRFRQVTPPPPTRYNRRGVIAPPPTQSARPNNRSITPTPQRRGYDTTYPQIRTHPVERNKTYTPQTVRPQRSSTPTNTYTPQRPPIPYRGGYTPQRSGSSYGVTRGGRGNE